MLSGLKRHDSHEFFSAPPGTKTDSSLHNKQIAAVLLLKDLLLKTPKVEYEPGKIPLKLTADSSRIIPAGNRPSLKLPPGSLDLLDVLLRHFKGIQCISNIVQFAARLEEVLRSLANSIEKTLPTYAYELDTESQLATVEGRAIGCKEKCPCCLRCCDVIHRKFDGITIGEGENRHKCIGGHQYRGMAGYSLKGVKWASVRTCNDIKDTDKLEIDGKPTTWSAFKEENKSWDFSIDTSLSSEQMNSNKAWMATLWQRVGPTICKEYPFTFRLFTESMTFADMTSYLPRKITP